MKWKNKGHEFDADAKKVIQSFKEHNEKIYLFGAGKIGYDIGLAMERYHVLGGFIDNNLEKQKRNLLDKQVLSVEQYLKEQNKGWIVVSVAGNIGNEIENQLIDLGLNKGIDFFTYEDFTTCVFPVLSFYTFGVLYADIAQISLTERCTLKCRKCAHGCYAVGTESKDLSIEEVYDSADYFFKYVDCVREFVLIGGEPLLYRKLADAIQYIGDKYRDKMVLFSITSNGTIIPEKKVLEMCRKYNVLFRISNYSNTLKWLQEKYGQLQKVLEDNGVQYSMGNPEGQWMDYGFDTVCREGQEEIIKVFDACKTPCREVRGCKYYYCVMARSVSENLGFDVGKGDYLNLKSIEDKKVFFEFNMGYSEKGYLDMCGHCHGSEAVEYPIPAAEQVKVL